MSDFNIGDIVVLKSGGPLMTVAGRFISNSGHLMIDAVWFTAGNRNLCGFHSDTIVKVGEDYNSEETLESV